MDLHKFHCGSGSSILGQCGPGSSFGSGSRVLMICKILQLKKPIFEIKNVMYLSLGLHEGGPATGEAFSTQTRTSSTSSSKHAISSFFFYLCGSHFALTPIIINAEPIHNNRKNNITVVPTVPGRKSAPGVQALVRTPARSNHRLNKKAHLYS